jgi:glycosyltransferase involved in cell wall biosynthesis
MQKLPMILFLCPYPLGGAPSQRFRFEQYLPLLQERGYRYAVHGFLDEATNRILYRPGQTLAKVSGVIRGFFRRLALLPTLYRAEFVFIHREATPIGPPWLEWLIARVLGKRIIYDFDDAIWLRDTSGVNDFMSRLKWQQKVPQICRWSYRVSAGNAYLADFARQQGAIAIINPTTLDTRHAHRGLKDQQEVPLSIGWTGSHSTMKYLYPLEGVLQQIEKDFGARTVVISNRPPEMDLSGLHYIPWTEAREVEDLREMHIGLMPLPDDPWARGKCGFKALQYLSLGIPALVSPVGVNTEIVTHGENGFHCASEEDWYHYLSLLLQDTDLRSRMGQAGRKTIEASFSVEANTENFLGLFEG